MRLKPTLPAIEKPRKHCRRLLWCPSAARPERLDRCGHVEPEDSPANGTSASVGPRTLYILAQTGCNRTPVAGPLATLKQMHQHDGRRLRKVWSVDSLQPHLERDRIASQAMHRVAVVTLHHSHRVSGSIAEAKRSASAATRIAVYCKPLLGRIAAPLMRGARRQRRPSRWVREETEELVASLQELVDRFKLKDLI